MNFGDDASRLAAEAPFGPELTREEAGELLRTRVNEVLERGKDRISVPSGEP